MACPAPNLMQHTYNPVTRDVMSLQRTKQVSKLQDACIKKIRKAIGINRMPRLQEVQLPSDLKQVVGSLCLSDFYIDPSTVTADNHRDRTFTATCLFDNTNVNICLHDSEEEARAEPFLLSLFKCNGITTAIYEPRQTLENAILKAKRDETPIDEKQIWMYMSQLCHVIKNSHPNRILEPRSLCFHQNAIIFKDNAVKSYPHCYKHVYSAPEVEMGQQATPKSLVWSLGCILYEMIMLKPAYVNMEPSGNVTLLMHMMRGNHKELPDDETYSEELIDLINDCMSKDVDDRPTIEEISELSLDKMFVL